jgi:hypothetical protein
VFPKGQSLTEVWSGSFGGHRAREMGADSDGKINRLMVIEVSDANSILVAFVGPETALDEWNRLGGSVKGK